VHFKPFGPSARRAAARGAVALTAAAVVVAAALTLPSALAGESEAETCLRTKIWDGYADGWGIRTMTTTELEIGKTRNYLVTLYKGNDYQVATCGDKTVTNLDVLLYDADGNVITRDNSTNREPLITFSPKETGSYYVVLYLRGLQAENQKAEAAMAVVYK
jgi:hypothetical protein